VARQTLSVAWHRPAAFPSRGRGVITIHADKRECLRSIRLSFLSGALHRRPNRSKDPHHQQPRLPRITPLSTPRQARLHPRSDNIVIGK
jgi:hypothetical protein